MSSHVKIIAVLTARPGATDRLRALLDGMLPPSRAELSNLRYDLWQDGSEPTRFVLDELYADADAVAAHRAPRNAALPGVSLSDRRARRAGRLRPGSPIRSVRTGQGTLRC